jgi:hypothetical protein
MMIMSPALLFPPPDDPDETGVVFSVIGVAFGSSFLISSAIIASAPVSALPNRKPRTGSPSEASIYLQKRSYNLFLQEIGRRRALNYFFLHL